MLLMLSTDEIFRKSEFRNYFSKNIELSMLLCKHLDGAHLVLFSFISLFLFYSYIFNE